VAPGTLSQAVSIPDKPYYWTRQSLDANQPAKYFGLPVDPRDNSVTVAVSPVGPFPAGVLDLAIYDRAGKRLLDLGAGSGQAMLQAKLPIGGLSPGQAGFENFYIRVELSSEGLALLRASEHPTGSPPTSTTDGGSGSSLSSSSTLSTDLEMTFDLEVLRDDTATTPTDSGSDVTVLPVVAPTPSSPVRLETSSGPESTEPTEETATAVPLNSEWSFPVPQAIPGPVATGPLPGRAAAPLGGVLADVDPAPEADQRDPAVVDLALLDMPGDAPDPAENGNPRSAAGQTDAASGRDPVVALRGPGGAPLLGSSLLTDPRAGRGPTVVSLAALTGASREPRLDAAELADHCPADAPPLPADPRAGSRASSPEIEPARARAVRRTSILAGLSVAFAMTLSLTLPGFTDPTPSEDDDDSPRSWVRSLLPRRRGHDSIGKTT
jgi:hypothetical protein